ncbi:HAD hydrolase family protein [bacterium]|nr:HAD hydrolase family protein [bacterium]
MNELKKRCQKIKLLAMDVDGVMTDGRMVLDSQGNDLKIFNVKDGVGIELLHQSSIKTAIITREISKIVTNRALKLKIVDVYQGMHEKVAAFKDLSDKYQIPYQEIAYIGDDLPDIPVLNLAGLSICPEDAILEVRKNCYYITKKSGGQGVIREVADLILKAQGKFNSTIKDYLRL